MRWIVRFTSISLLSIAAVLGGIWLLAGPTLAEVPVEGMIALALTLILTAALAVGLMALVFFSARTKRD